VGLPGFKCEKAWRFWSEVEQGVHYAVYQFAGKAKLDKALASDDFKALVADFNRSWPEGVTRTHDIVTLVEEVRPRSSAVMRGLTRSFRTSRQCRWCSNTAKSAVD